MKQTVSLVITATLLVVSLAAQSGLSHVTTYGAAPGWKVPRTADGNPDLQGVWGNNSVTPMTRPTQWKNKEVPDRCRGDGAAGTRGAQRQRPGGDAIFGGFIQLALDAKDFREIRSGVLRPDHRQLQPVLDVGAGMGQPDVAHHRSGRWPAAAADRRRARRIARAGRGPVEGSESGPRGPADGPEDRPLSERCISSACRASGTGYNSYIQIVQSPETVVILQEMIHDVRMVPMDGSPRCRRTCVNSRRCLAAGGKATRSSSKRRTTSTDSRSGRGRSGARRLDAEREADRALHARESGLHQLGDHGEGSSHVDAAVDLHDPAEAHRRPALRICVPRRQHLDDRHPGRRTGGRSEGGDTEITIFSVAPPLRGLSLRMTFRRSQPSP